MSQKVIDLLEQLLKEVKAHGCGATAAVAELNGNRTPPVYDYDGGNEAQNLMDVARRAVRYAKAGKHFSAKERNIARQVMREFKDAYDGDVEILNTNGHDIWTLNGA